MAKQLKYIAQSAEDMYYGDHRGQSDFFDFDDFVRYCGYTLMDILLQEYRVRRSENRSEKKDEVISFSADWEVEERVKVSKDGDAFIAQLPSSILSFPYDRQSSALQDVKPVKPRRITYERGNIEEEWSYRYLPASDRVFWVVRPQQKEHSVLEFFTKGVAIEEVLIRYIPEPTEDTLVPNGVENYIITTTIMNMRQIENGVIIDKTNDGNPNKVLQTEVNKSNLVR